jgi:SprT-like family
MKDPYHFGYPSGLAPATRAVHTAMSASVRDRGVPQSQALYQAADRFNHEHFAGVLTAILVEITAPGSPRAYATHSPRTPEGVDCVIRIAPSTVDAGERLAHDVLLHEMIHVWQAETDNREPGYAGHGPKFAAECNRIGKALGLAEVGVKGRGRAADGSALPDCAGWPLNVRPEGYYGDAPRAVKAVAAATKAKTAPKVRAPKETAVDKALAAVAALSPADRAVVRAALVTGALADS